VVVFQAGSGVTDGVTNTLDGAAEQVRDDPVAHLMRGNNDAGHVDVFVVHFFLSFELIV